MMAQLPVMSGQQNNENCLRQILPEECDALY